MYANSLSYQSFMKFINWEQKGNFKHRLIRIMLRTELSDIDLNETKRYVIYTIPIYIRWLVYQMYATVRF